MYYLTMYSTFDNVKSAFVSAWKYKVLWIFAALLMGGSSMGFGNSFSNFDKTESDNDSQYNTTPTSFKSLTSELGYALPSDVLGVSTDKSFQNQTSDSFFIKNIFSEFVWLMPQILQAAIFIIILAFLGYAIKLVVASWAMGAFYNGLFKAVNNESLGFKELGSNGRILWRRYLKLSLFILLIGFLICLAGGGLISLFIYLIKLKFVIPAVIGIAIVSITMLLAFINLSFISNYVYRAVADSELTSMQALKLGWKYFRYRPGKTLKLLLFLGLTSLVCVLIVAVVLGALVALGLILTESNNFLQVFGYLMVFIPVPAGVIFAVCGSAFLYTVYAFSWTKLFLFIKNSITEVESGATNA